MLKQTFIGALFIFVVLFAVKNSSAQIGGPCLLGVGNCPTTTTSNQNNVDPGNRRINITDARAGEIWNAKQKNQRYLLVLQRYFDTQLNQWCEERAWVGEMSGNQTQVVVKVGQSKKVCFAPGQTTWTAQQVNLGGQWIDNWTTQIYQWEKYQQQVAAYLNNPTYRAWAIQENQKSVNATNTLRNYIDTYQKSINQFAP